MRAGQLDPLDVIEEATVELIRAEAITRLTNSGVTGRVSAFAEHFFDVDVTKSQRSQNSHSSPLNGLSGRW